jgi:hypothetical protein
LGTVLSPFGSHRTDRERQHLSGKLCWLSSQEKIAGTVFSCSGKMCGAARTGQKCRFPILISRSARCVLNFQVVSEWILFALEFV